ncbi:hypothetical protein GR254_10220, partial [Mycobacterium tuberculosis]|nr:hypothetical protein [Mycobacterium tuberculosis]
DGPTALRFPKGDVGEDISALERRGGVDVLAAPAARRAPRHLALLADQRSLRAHAPPSPPGPCWPNINERIPGTGRLEGGQLTHAEYRWQPAAHRIHFRATNTSSSRDIRGMQCWRRDRC